MTNPLRDRILIVESDPVISDVIARQALQAAGYQTFIVGDASAAISRIVQLLPDIVIANLNLPGLSGKDLLVALGAQGLDVPVIIVANKGMEADIIQAFRVGATDYLLWPAREPEVINVVERALRQVRERRERERLQKQLQQINQELQMRVRELTTIFSIGKAVTSITDSSLLFERILEGAIKVTQGELGWFLLRDDPNRPFRMAAQRGLPANFADRLNQSWDDGISSLVALSGESLTIHGEPLKRFKISILGQAALIIPVKVQKQVIGLLVVLRKAAQAFTSSEQHLAEAVADYASISLVNAQLFRTVEERARSLEAMAGTAKAGEKINSEILSSVKDEVRNGVEISQAALDRLVKDPAARWNSLQRQDLTALQEQIKNVGRVAEAISPIQLPQAPTAHPLANLAELARQAAMRYQHFAQQNNLTLVSEIPGESLVVEADPAQLTQVLHGLLSNAIKFSVAGGHVTLRVERTPDMLVHVIIADSGVGIDPSAVSHIFDASYRPPESRSRRFGGLGIGLNLVREIITNQKGKIWVESKPGNGTRFHFTLPIVRAG